MRPDPGGGEGQGETCLENLEETVCVGVSVLEGLGTAAVDGDTWRSRATGGWVGTQENPWGHLQICHKCACLSKMFPNSCM